MPKTEAQTALVIQPIHEIEGHEKYIALKEQSLAILNQSKKLQVRSQPTMDDAAEKRASVKLLLKQIKTVKEEYVRPINDRKGQILELFKALNVPLNEADTIIGDKMVAFQKVLEAEEIRREEEIRKKQEEERKRLEQEALETQKKLEEAQTEEEVEDAVQQAGEVEQKLEKVYEAPTLPTKKLAPKIRRTSGGGSTSFRDVRKCELVNFVLLPDEYKKKIADMDKIVAVVRAGVNFIPGVRIWIEKQPVTRTGRF